MDAMLVPNPADIASYPTVFDPNTLVEKGLCPVTTIAGEHRNRAEGVSLTEFLPESHSLYFEIHGDGPQKLVLIEGHNATSFAWQGVVEYFTGMKEHDGSFRYSALVFDNRGVGNSTAPWGPSNTSGMAEDVMILLEYIGWTLPCQLHVIGLSMGGMIALELASRIHSRIASLSLLVTTAGGYTTSCLPPWRGFRDIVRMTFTAKVAEKVAIAMPLCHPEGWLDQPAVEYDRPNTTYGEHLRAETFRRMALAKPQTLTGVLSQIVAPLTHRVNSTRLTSISRSIPKVYIAVGDKDHLIKITNSFWMKDQMPEAEFEQWKNTGHGILGQHPKRLPKTLARVATEGWRISHPEAQSSPLQQQSELEYYINLSWE